MGMILRAEDGILGGFVRDVKVGTRYPGRNPPASTPKLFYLDATRDPIEANTTSSKTHNLMFCAKCYRPGAGVSSLLLPLGRCRRLCAAGARNFLRRLAPACAAAYAVEGPGLGSACPQGWSVNVAGERLHADQSAARDPWWMAEGEEARERQESTAFGGDGVQPRLAVRSETQTNRGERLLGDAPIAACNDDGLRSCIGRRVRRALVCCVCRGRLSCGQRRSDRKRQVARDGAQMRRVVVDASVKTERGLCRRLRRGLGGRAARSAGPGCVLISRGLGPGAQMMVGLSGISGSWSHRQQRTISALDRHGAGSSHKMPRDFYVPQISTVSLYQPRAPFELAFREVGAGSRRGLGNPTGK